MKVSLKPGKYVVAVSGGVDSIVLLDLLAKQSGKWKMKSEEQNISPLSPLPSPLELVVAHFNHGIRADSDEDEELVVRTAEKYGLPAEVGRARLGPNASEALAREARYNFLNSAKKKYAAKAIVTAHHQDDLVETALLNVLRGTGYKGLVAIAANRGVARPLLGFPKNDLIEYARANNLEWREDSTNSDARYLRNYLRRQVTARLTPGQRDELVKNIEKVAKTNNKLDSEIAKLSQYIMSDSEISRGAFANLPTNISNELMAYWLRRQHALDFDRRTINRLSVALKTARAGTIQPVKDRVYLKIAKDTARFSRR